MLKYAGKFVPDPSYIDLPGYHDVAIIVIAEEYNYLALPIVSRDNDEFKHGRPATAIGWGEIKEGTGLTPKKLKIARDIIPTDLLCGYKPQTLCGTSISGRAARGDQTSIVRMLNALSCLGDSGGPLVIEGDSAKTDVVFGIFSTMATENGLHTMTFTNIPYYLDKFISPYARAIEKVRVQLRGFFDLRWCALGDGHETISSMPSLVSLDGNSATLTSFVGNKRLFQVVVSGRLQTTAT